MTHPRPYAYVKSESCKLPGAFLPGSEYNEIPVSRHGDLTPWYYGKRDTKAILDAPVGKYRRWFRQSAFHVALLRGWVTDLPVSELL